MKYLHNHRVIHRDLKLGNLFLNEKMEIKIGDFGLATKLEFEGERKRTICGTPNYIAPEVLEGKQGHSYEVDIWSLGVIIYTLIIGKPPFETSDVKTTYRRIKMNAYTFPEHVQISDAARSLISKILHSDPTKRPGIDDILNSEFMTMNQIPRVLPASTLACPPSGTYVRQFMTQGGAGASVPNRLESTAPAAGKDAPYSAMQREKNNMLNTDRQKVMSQGASKPELKEPAVWVKKWVDYSSKYGLGYLLSSGASGVFFNDSTKIILDPNGHHFEYLERRTSDK